MRMRPDDANLYSFVQNEPTTHFDSLGLQSWIGPGYGCAGLCDGILNGPKWPKPQGYDCSCCDDKQTQKGLDELNERFKKATAYLASKGVTPDADETGPNTLSCYDSAEAIVNFMSPAPACWLCFVEERGPWLPGMYSHNAVVCFSVRDNSKEVFFDWFGGRTEAANYSLFELAYPTRKTSYPDRDYRQFNDCSRRDEDKKWTPDYGRFPKLPRD